MKKFLAGVMLLALASPAYAAKGGKPPPEPAGGTLYVIDASGDLAGLQAGKPTKFIGVR